MVERFSLSRRSPFSLFLFPFSLSYSLLFHFFFLIFPLVWMPDRSSLKKNEFLAVYKSITRRRASRGEGLAARRL